MGDKTPNNVKALETLTGIPAAEIKASIEGYPSLTKAMVSGMEKYYSVFDKKPQLTVRQVVNILYGEVDVLIQKRRKENV
jgi:hypothetical protein